MRNSNHLVKRVLAYLQRAKQREPEIQFQDNYHDAACLVRRAAAGETGDLYRLVFQWNYGTTPEKARKREAEWEAWFLRSTVPTGATHAGIPKKLPARETDSGTSRAAVAAAATLHRFSPSLANGSPVSAAEGQGCMTGRFRRHTGGRVRLAPAATLALPFDQAHVTALDELAKMRSIDRVTYLRQWIYNQLECDFEKAFGLTLGEFVSVIAPHREGVVQ